MPQVPTFTCKAHYQNNMSISMALESLLIIGKCVHIWVEWSTPELPNKVEHSWTREQSACYLSGHLPQTSLLNSLEDCEAQLPWDPKFLCYGDLPLQRKECIFKWPYQHRSWLWLSESTLSYFEKKKIAAHAITATLEMSSPLHFFSMFSFVVLDCPQLVWGEYSGL